MFVWTFPIICLRQNGSGYPGLRVRSGLQLASAKPMLLPLGAVSLDYLSKGDYSLRLYPYYP